MAQPAQGTFKKYEDYYHAGLTIYSSRHFGAAWFSLQVVRRGIYVRTRVLGSGLSTNSGHGSLSALKKLFREYSYMQIVAR